MSEGNPDQKVYVCAVFSPLIISEKSLVSAVLGPEMAAPILWAPGKMRSLCIKTHVHKVPPFRGGILGFLGGECRFYSYGREDFSDNWLLGPFFRRSKMAFFGLYTALFGFRGLCRGTGRLQTQSEIPHFLGGSSVGVWNGWGYGFAFFRALNFFKFRSLTFGENRSFCGISGIFLEILASENFFGLWKMAVPYATNPYPH